MSLNSTICSTKRTLTSAPSMKTIIPQFIQPHFLFNFPPISFENPNFNFPIPKSCQFHSQKVTFRCLPSSSTVNFKSYNGWDDLRPQIESSQFSDSNYLQKFLISLGIDDKKYVFVYVLGFACALAISRVRVSSIIVFPATAIVFAIGFSFGVVNGGRRNWNGGKRGVKEDAFRVYVDKLKSLEDLIDGFEGKVRILKNNIEKAIDCRNIDVGELESYVSAVESIGSCFLTAKTVVEDCVNGVLSENQEVEKSSRRKTYDKKKDGGKGGFDLFKFAWNFGSENAAGLKSSKANEVGRREQKKKDLSNPVQNDSSDLVVEERASDSMFTSNGNNSKREKPRGASGYQFSQWKGQERLADKSTRRFASADELNYQSSRLRFINNQHVDFEMSEYNEIGKRDSQHNLHNNIGRKHMRTQSSHHSLHESMNVSIRREHMKSESSLTREQMLGDSHEDIEFSEGWENGERGTYTSIEDGLHTSNYQYEADTSPTSASTVSDDMLFDKYLTRASNLLKRAKHIIKVPNDETDAEKMLNETAKLLSQAIAMKPVSLLAVGQLGNTYLVHGELKLRISRELRSSLSRTGNFEVERRSNLLVSSDETLPSRDRIATLLVNVCEECEELLVEAGRKYRMALSIDRSDVRALYNWGLALSFRAQLIADIGPEAALDADKLFLAAIDKFDAMMSRGNVYAPDALFRWGMALQQRSRLRPSNSRDKLKLLQQAKRLYEDALDMGSDNRLLREALSSCVSELDFRTHVNDPR